jgi:hypothetical protein
MFKDSLAFDKLLVQETGGSEYGKTTIWELLG